MTSLEKALRWIVIIGIFILPIVPMYIANTLFFPFITGKNFMFRIVVEIMAASWLALALVSDKFRPRRNWILGALAIFVLSIAISNAQGVYPFKSFWSNYERMDGWITIAHLLIFTTIASAVLNTEVLWRRLFQWSLVISVLLSFYGSMQVMGLFALGGGATQGSLTNRIDSTFGNPIYMAVYMLFHIFIAAILWAQSWIERGPGKRMWHSVFYGFVIAFDTLALLFSGTRGTMVGLAVGILVVDLLVIVLAPRSRNAWRVAVASLVALIILAAGFFAVRDAQWVSRIGFLSRLATISTSDKTVYARFLNWGMAWQGVKERPVLGWGQENYAIVFDKYYDPRMYAQEQWFDRVHNIVFDWLVAGGFVGLFTYLSIFFATLWAIWRRTVAGTPVFTIAERSLLTGLLIAYFIHNFFVFDNVTSYIMFGMVLAYVIWRTNDARKSRSVYAGELLPRKALPVVAVIMAVVAWGAIYQVNGRAIAANRALISAINPGTSPSNPLVNLDYFKKSIAYGTFGMQEAREQLTQVTSQLANANVSPDVKKQFYETTISEMNKQAEMSPLDARFPLFIGVVQDAYGQYADGAVSLQKAHELSLGKQSILFEMGMNAIARGDTKGAIETFKKAFELDPSYDQARIMYAAILIQNKMDAQADEVLAPVISSGVAADQRISTAYAQRGQFNKIVTIWSAKIKATPDDIQAYFTLAAALYTMGDRTGSIAVLESVKQKAPQAASQADTFIQQIKTGTANVN